MKHRFLAMTLGIACSAAICAPHRRALVVSDAELTGISTDDRARVEAKVALLKKAEDVRTTKKAALAVAEREVQIAALSVSRDKTALDIAELKFQAAQETKDADTMLPAKKAREEANTQLQRSLADQKYHKANRDYLEQMVVVGEAEIPVASANLELAKYEAATRSNGGPDGERLAGFKSQVAAAEADLAEVQVSAAKAKTAMDAANPRDLPAEAPASSNQGTAAVAPAASPDAAQLP